MAANGASASQPLVFPGLLERDGSASHPENVAAGFDARNRPLNTDGQALAK